MQNSFAAGCGGGCVRAESKRECESAKCERIELTFCDVLAFWASCRDWLRGRCVSSRADNCDFVWL
jgi:hypothetical protein